jgi:FixJ family two-component response regulator
MDKQIYLIDDDASIRESLSFLFSTLNWPVVSFAGIDAFVAAHPPGSVLCGCLLLDMRMPGKGGLSWLEEREWPWPQLPVVVMTGHGTVDACRRAFRHGAFEFFTKPLDADRLIESVQAAFDDSDKRFAQWQEQQRLQTLFGQLTVRENDVLVELMAGLSNKEVAQRLNLSPRTVEAHRAAIFSKLGVSSLVQVIREHDKFIQVILPG